MGRDVDITRSTEKTQPRTQPVQMTRTTGFHSYRHFVLINWLLALLIAHRYFTFLPTLPLDGLSRLFLLLSLLSQMALLSAAFALCLLPAMWLPTKARQIVLALGATLALAMLAVDTLVFSQYRFHVNAVILKLAMNEQVVSFPLVMWLTVLAALALVFILEWAVLRLLHGRHGLQALKLDRWCLTLACMALLATHAIHIWAAAHGHQSITQVRRYLPLFYPATSSSTMRKLGWIDEAELEKQKLLTAQKTSSDIHYPARPLETRAVTEPVNIVMLVIDSWRADAFNAVDTPQLWQFAQQGMMLNRHLSSGNATRAGIFGLFYGIPATYWHSALDNQTPPVLLNRLQALNYHLGIFASAPLNNPEFDQTVFRKVQHLRSHSKAASTAGRDAEITREWLQWFDARERTRPTFSFVFYDAPHGYAFPDDYAHQFQPLLKDINYLQRTPETDPQPWRNRYRTSLHYVDSLAGQILQRLQASGEMDNTIVIITGDHGEEFNDNGLNYWGHNSNFSAAQIHVPFAMVGKHIQAGASWQERMTSHVDLAPTLLKNHLGVSNALGDYSTGKDLLGDPIDRPWLLSASYSQYALISRQGVLEMGGAGQYQHVDHRYHPLPEKPNFAHLREALHRISRFSNPAHAAP